jgi:arginine utilization regulatory protein
LYSETKEHEGRIIVNERDYLKLTQEVFRLIEEGIHVLDAEGNTVIYNQAMAQMEKMQQKEVLSKPFREVFGNIGENESTLLQALNNRKTTANLQQTYRNKDGKEITTINSSYPVAEDGRLIGAIEIARNITEIQKMYHAIMKLREEAPEPTTPKEHKIKKYNFSSLIGENAEFKEAIVVAQKASLSNASVMIYGETGTGKELIAQSIHFGGPRAEKPFLAQNCAALPENLLEGILFGTAKGGFTGALDRAGLFEQADGGTLLLDEISAMPYDLQGKLLRVLQEDYIRRVGGSRDIPLDVRIIATINVPAESLLESGKLRRDLYYRLNIIPIELPPLQRRRDDILLLAERFLEKQNRIMNKNITGISGDAKAKLLDYDYPGNVRELENIIMASVSMVENESELTAKHINIKKKRLNATVDYEKVIALGLDRYLDDIEEELIRVILEVNNGNRSRTAEQLGIKRQTLQYKLKKER